MKGLCCTVSDEAYALILHESKTRFPLETGGILIGKIDDNIVHIEYATGPGPVAYHSRSRFQRDGDYSQVLLDTLVRYSRAEYDYIGEWHSHPAPVKPSSIDIKAMQWIIQNPKYAIVQPILGICTRIERDEWALGIFVFTNGQLQRLPLGK